MLSVSIVCYLGIVLLYSCSCYLGIVQLQGVNRKCHLHIWGPPLCHMVMNMVNMLVKRRLVWFEFLLYAKMHMASKGRVCSLIRSSDETMPQLCVKMCFRINNISHSLNPNHDSYFESIRISLITHLVAGGQIVQFMFQNLQNTSSTLQSIIRVMNAI